MNFKTLFYRVPKELLWENILHSLISIEDIARLQVVLGNELYQVRIRHVLFLVIIILINICVYRYLRE